MELFKPLDDHESTDVARMLDRGARTGGLTFSQFDGLICAISVAPNLVPPSIWLETLFGDEGPPFASLEEAQRYLGLVMRHYNAVVTAIADGSYVPALPPRKPPGAENRAQQWATGFMLGMSLDDAWETIAGGDDAMLLAPILILADAKTYVRDATPNAHASETLISMLPKMLPIIRDYWSKRRHPARASRAKRVPAVRAVRTVHRLKIALLGVKPAIWRRVEIASDAKLPAVSKVMLMAMGWTDTHLHAFNVGRRTFTDLDPDFPNDDLDERRYTLAHVLPRVKDSLRFDYDFGDGWQHRVTLEAIVSADPDARYPRCVAGRRACPPEDCGGPYGYAEFLEAIGDPTHPEHERLLEWSGPFDADAFDLLDTNLGLDSIFRKRGRRLASADTPKS